MGEGVNPVTQAIAAQLARAEAQEVASFLRAVQIDSAKNFLEEVEDAFNPFSADKKTEFKALEQRRFEATAKHQALAEQKLQDPNQSAAMADQRQNDNPDLNRQSLMQLREWVLSGKQSPEEILAEVMRVYGEAWLADEALAYLLDATDGEVAERVLAARELLQERHGREVQGGRNVAADSRSFATKGIGSPTELRSLYLDVTGEQQEHNALFEKLSGEYAFGQLKDVVEFLLRSLGADLKAEGPSISRGRLYWMVTEVRILQSILGIYNFFLSREQLMKRLFYEHGLTMPGALNFERMAKTFMKLVEDRYPSSVKLLRLARELEIEEELLSQIIVYSQFRDAVRQVAPRIYRSLKHRYDLLMAIIEGLEELEEELEEEEEEEEEEEKEEDGDV